MKNENNNSNQKDLQFIDLRLQNGQVELILRAMELFCKEGRIRDGTEFYKLNN